MELDVGAVFIQCAEVARWRRVEALVDAVGGVAFFHAVVVEEDPQIRRAQYALGVRCIPTNLRFGSREEVLTTGLIDVQFTALVTVGDLTLEVVVISGIDAILKSRRRCPGHVGHGHEAQLVELVQFI